MKWKYTIASYVPASIHPNFITLLGITSFFITFILFILWNNYQILGLGIFIYMICDGIDGVHARNINKTSRFGEILDHMFDHYIIFSIVYCSIYYIPNMYNSTFFSIPLLNIGFISLTYCTITEMIQYNNGKGVSQYSIVLTLLFTIFIFIFQPIISLYLNINIYYNIYLCCMFLPVLSLTITSLPSISQSELFHILDFFINCIISYDNSIDLLAISSLYNICIISRFEPWICYICKISTIINILKKNNFSKYIIPSLSIKSSIYLLIKNINIYNHNYDIINRI